MRLKNIKGLIFMLLIAFIVVMHSVSAFATSFAKITVLVIDDNNHPIENAAVSLGFRIYTKGGWDSKSTSSEGQTDRNGRYSGSALADNFVAFSVTKEGYYQSFGDYKFKESSLGRWVPWNPEVTVVLRKVENPVPMYIRDTSSMHPVLEIPVIGKAVGYDLIESDWVSPYGTGKHSDIIFRLDRKFVNNDDFDGTLTITFPNKHDGIQLVKYDRNRGSNFKLPRFAPEEGYQQKLVRTFSKKPDGPYKDSAKEDNNYYFRVRAEEKNGKFYRAMYGKIHGDIQFDVRGHKTASIIFKYFLNPDYTRNMESGENLLKLPKGEQVGRD